MMAFVTSSSAVAHRPTARRTCVCPSSSSSSSSLNLTTTTTTTTSAFLGTKLHHHHHHRPLSTTTTSSPSPSPSHSPSSYPSRSPPRCTLAKPQSRTANVIKAVDSPADLDRVLHAQSDDAVTVVMCSAGYCAGCRGAAPKYKKVAAAYADDRDVTFTKMDFVANEQFCRAALGVDNLPFFVVFKGDRISSGEAMGWRVVTKKLVDRIEAAVAKPVSAN